MKKDDIKGVPLGYPAIDTGFEECNGVRYANTSDFRFVIEEERIECDSKGNRRRVLVVKLIDLRDPV